MLLEMKDVVKQFGGLTAVSNMSFQVDEGEIYGVIGPNEMCIRDRWSAFTKQLKLIYGAINVKQARQEFEKFKTDWQAYPGAVSYTHLDVYKRQGSISGSRWHRFYPSLW